MKQLFQHMQHNGFWSTWSQLVESLDPFGEKNALKSLGLGKGASQEEIKFKMMWALAYYARWHLQLYIPPSETLSEHPLPPPSEQPTQLYETVTVLFPKNCVGSMTHAGSTWPNARNREVLL